MEAEVVADMQTDWEITVILLLLWCSAELAHPSAVTSIKGSVQQNDNKERHEYMFFLLPAVIFIPLDCFGVGGRDFCPFLTWWDQMALGFTMLNVSLSGWLVWGPKSGHQNRELNTKGFNENLESSGRGGELMLAAPPQQRGGGSWRCRLGAQRVTLRSFRESRLGDRGAGGWAAGWLSADPGSVSSLKRWRRHD